MTGGTLRQDRALLREAETDTFADRLAEAIVELIANGGPHPHRRGERPQTVEQSIAAAIYKELPR